MLMEKDFEEKNRQAVNRLKKSGFFSRWWRGTKAAAKSPSGSMQASLIINAFITVGCFLGAWQVKLSQGGIPAIAFVLFAFGVLQLIMWFGQLKQYKMILKQEAVFRELNNARKEQ